MCLHQFYNIPLVLRNNFVVILAGYVQLPRIYEESLHTTVPGIGYAIVLVCTKQVIAHVALAARDSVLDAANMVARDRVA